MEPKIFKKRPGEKTGKKASCCSDDKYFQKLRHDLQIDCAIFVNDAMADFTKEHQGAFTAQKPSEISLRDKIAMQCLEYDYANTPFISRVEASVRGQIARRCYAMADAMMEARGEKKDG